MDTEEPQQSDAAQIRKVIEDFLGDRLNQKLSILKEGDVDGKTKLLSRFSREPWIADAAKRISQIKQATHPIKFIHPSIKKCTSVISSGLTGASELLIGTHTLKGSLVSDVAVENAASLDLYKFLCLTINEYTILQRAVSGDEALYKAFSDEMNCGKQWAESFANFALQDERPKSNKLAKQIYWPIEYNQYHILAPMFSSPLAHKLWLAIRHDRFSDEAKTAREARRKNEYHSHGYREYPNIVVQQFGGTKPQNISQLNSERYGENYLLPSLPPVWRSEPIKPPLYVESVFDGWFDRRPRVRSLVRTLREFLYNVTGATGNVRIRNKRKELLGYLMDELLLFSAELQDLEHDWTLNEACKLNIDEQCWLNPSRKETDSEFAAVYTFGEWKDAVSKRFANWLNARLTDTKKPLPFGENEASEWQAILSKEINALRMEIDTYE